MRDIPIAIAESIATPRSFLIGKLDEAEEATREFVCMSSPVIARPTI
jgi:hypothetical protein